MVMTTVTRYLFIIKKMVMDIILNLARRPVPSLGHIIYLSDHLMYLYLYLYLHLYLYLYSAAVC